MQILNPVIVSLLIALPVSVTAHVINRRSISCQALTQQECLFPKEKWCCGTPGQLGTYVYCATVGDDYTLRSCDQAVCHQDEPGIILCSNFLSDNWPDKIAPRRERWCCEMLDSQGHIHVAHGDKYFILSWGGKVKCVKGRILTLVNHKLRNGLKDFECATTLAV